MGLVVDKVTLGQVLIPALRCSPVTVIPRMFHTRSSTFHRRHVMMSNGMDVKKRALGVTTVQVRAYLRVQM